MSIAHLVRPYDKGEVPWSIGWYSYRAQKGTSVHGGGAQQGTVWTVVGDRAGGELLRCSVIVEVGYPDLLFRYGYGIC